MKLAFLFPGQGSQYVGMGADLYAHVPQVTRLFEEADLRSGFKLSTICFYGPEDRLNGTDVAQPALLTVSVAASVALQLAGVSPSAVAGHSVGEYAALVTAGAMSFQAALELVVRRANSMARAASSRAGTMAAILGIGADEAAQLCRQAEAQGEGIVDVANVNGAGQVVISGEPGAVLAVSEAARAAGAKRVKELNVSGAFHSRLMHSSADEMTVYLRDAMISDPALPVVANVTAEYESDAAQIRGNLAAQVWGTVRWEESINRLTADGYDTFVEVGPGNVLSNLMKRISPGATILGASDTASVSATVQAIAAGGNTA